MTDSKHNQPSTWNEYAIHVLKSLEASDKDIEEIKKLLSNKACMEDLENVKKEVAELKMEIAITKAKATVRATFISVGLATGIPVILWLIETFISK